MFDFVSLHFVKQHGMINQEYTWHYCEASRDYLSDQRVSVNSQEVINHTKGVSKRLCSGSDMYIIQIEKSY